MDVVGKDQPEEVDIRLIAATNRNLREEATTGTFREDLYFRLAVVEIAVPALRDHLEDIEPMARHFVARAARDHLLEIPDEVLDELKRRPWPGNVRELENACERMAILATGPEVCAADLPQLVRSGRLGALGQLNAGLAHEIKNPLHAMRGTAEIFREVVDSERPERRMVDLHLQEIDRLTGVLERFLAFARPKTTSHEVVDLVGVVQRVCELAAAQTRKTEVQLDASKGHQPHPVMGDGEALVQVVLSIVLNSLDDLASWDGRGACACRCCWSAAAPIRAR